MASTEDKSIPGTPYDALEDQKTFERVPGAITATGQAWNNMIMLAIAIHQALNDFIEYLDEKYCENLLKEYIENLELLQKYEAEHKSFQLELGRTQEMLAILEFITALKAAQESLSKMIAELEKKIEEINQHLKQITKQIDLTKDNIKNISEKILAIDVNKYEKLSAIYENKDECLDVNLEGDDDLPIGLYSNESNTKISLKMIDVIDKVRGALLKNSGETGYSEEKAVEDAVKDCLANYFSKEPINKVKSLIEKIRTTDNFKKSVDIFIMKANSCISNEESNQLKKLKTEKVKLLLNLERLHEEKNTHEKDREENSEIINMYKSKSNTLQSMQQQLLQSCAAPLRRVDANNQFARLSENFKNESNAKSNGLKAPNYMAPSPDTTEKQQPGTNNAVKRNRR
jgi:hypothetical protein